MKVKGCIKDWQLTHSSTRVYCDIIFGRSNEERTDSPEGEERWFEDVERGFGHDFLPFTGNKIL